MIPESLNEVFEIAFIESIVNAENYRLNRRSKTERADNIFRGKIAEGLVCWYFNKDNSKTIISGVRTLEKKYYTGPDLIYCQDDIIYPVEVKHIKYYNDSEIDNYFIFDNSKIKRFNKFLEKESTFTVQIINKESFDWYQSNSDTFKTENCIVRDKDSYKVPVTNFSCSGNILDCLNVNQDMFNSKLEESKERFDMIYGTTN